MKSKCPKYYAAFSKVFNYMEWDNILGVMDNGVATSIFLKTPKKIDHDAWVDTIVVGAREESVIEAFVYAWGLDWITIDFGDE
ncbi:MAG: hypothetical protein JRJ45_00340 [Deltaproteobacteria bacterium]|nr:hypothetical protein [Deltaproteobacteria bacterium]